MDSLLGIIEKSSMARVDEEVEGEIVIERRRGESEEGGRCELQRRAKRGWGDSSNRFLLLVDRLPKQTETMSGGEEEKDEVVVVGRGLTFTSQ